MSLRNHNANRDRKHFHLLTGHLFCFKCGQRLWAEVHKKKQRIQILFLQALWNLQSPRKYRKRSRRTHGEHGIFERVYQQSVNDSKKTTRGGPKKLRK